MTIYLDEQLEDEPLFGIVARYLEQVPGANDHGIIRHLFGRVRLASILGCGLDQVARETEACWGFSPTDIVEKMTCFPYIAALISPIRARQTLDKMIGGNSLNPRGGIAPAGDTRRFCKVCLDQDRQLNGIGHWRRVHQLPGIVVCPWHGELLWRTWGRGNLNRHRGYFSPAIAIELGAVPIDLPLTGLQKISCHEVAHVSADLLHGRIEVDSQNLASTFAAFVRKQSRYLVGNRRDDCIDRMLTHCFGDEYLTVHGVRNEKSSFLAALRSSDFRPLRAVVALTVMRIIAEKFVVFDDSKFADLYDDLPPGQVRSIQKTPLPPLICPSRLAAHGALHAAEKVIRRFGRLRAVCSCGMCFSCAETIDGANDVSVTVWGPDYVHEAHRLYAGGMGGPSVASILGIPERTIYNMKSASKGQ